MPASSGQRPIIAATDLDDQRPILFVGDIQGCSGELAQLLEASGYQARTHRLVPLGDTINRGPDAPGVLTLLREQGAEPIIGNHELHLIQLAANGLAPSPSDKARSAASQLAGAGQWPQVLEWIRQWPNGRLGPGWIAVHAGLHPRLSVEETPPSFLANVRYCTAEGERPSFGDGNLPGDPEGYRPWFAFYRGERTVFYGHWARRGLNLLDRVRGLDSGCVYGGPLTGFWWPEGRLVQVPSRQPFRRLTDKA
jgi:bis(5'-nucleosyl)-tetraphosphatase (symmetrical)